MIEGRLSNVLFCGPLRFAQHSSVRPAPFLVLSARALCTGIDEDLQRPPVRISTNDMPSQPSPPPFRPEMDVPRSVIPVRHVGLRPQCGRPQCDWTCQVWTCHHRCPGGNSARSPQWAETHLQFLAARILVCIAVAHGQSSGAIRHYLQILPYECRSRASRIRHTNVKLTFPR